MKIHVMVLVGCLLTLSGCASFKDWSNAQGRASQAREDEQIALIEKLHRDRQALLQPGSKQQDFTDRWGDPHRTEFMDGKWIWHYTNGGEPVDLVFVDGKLTGWTYDRARMAQDRAIAEQRAAETRAAEERRWNRLGDQFRQNIPQKVQIVR